MRRLVALLLTLALVAAGCSDDSDSSEAETPDPAPTTTTTTTTTMTTVEDGQVGEEAAFTSVWSADGELMVAVPTAESTPVEVALLDPAEWPAFLGSAESSPGVKIYDLQPSGATFDEPVHVFRRVQIENLGLGDLEPFDIPIVTLFTTDGEGAPELLQELRIVRAGEELYVGGSLDHFSPVISSNDRTAAETNEVFRALLASVQDAEGNQVIDLDREPEQRPVTDFGIPPIDPDRARDDGAPFLGTTGGERPLLTIDVGTGSTTSFAPRLPEFGNPDVLRLDLVDDDLPPVENAEIDGPAYEPLQLLFRYRTGARNTGDIHGLGTLSVQARVLADVLGSTSTLAPEVDEILVELSVVLAPTGPPRTDQPDPVLGDVLALLSEEGWVDRPAETVQDRLLATYLAGTPFEVSVDHSAKGRFPSKTRGLFQPTDDVSPPGLFLLTLDGTNAIGPDTRIVDAAPVPTADPPPLAVDTGIECFCRYGFGLAESTDLDAEFLRGTGTVRGLLDAGVDVWNLRSGGEPIIVEVGPSEGTVFSGPLELEPFDP